jgi:TDG/mug DNA glycosylase family protein
MSEGEENGGGLTPRLFSAFEESLLFDLKFGSTNIVERATARADELTDDELRAGGRRLQAKVRRWRPTVVAFVGIHPTASSPVSDDITRRGK